MQSTKDYTWLKNLLVVLGASALLCLTALISIPLPFTPVPIVFSLQMILFFSVWLGRRGFLATLSYLGVGAMGLPVFAGGAGSVAAFMGPTGGYLVGFALASLLVAYFSERMEKKSHAKIFGLMLLGNGLVYLFGVPHLALFVGWDRAIALGLIPFVGGGVVKLMLAHQALRKVGFFK